MAQPKQERLEFDRELGTIEAKVIELFSMVAEDLPKATDVLLNTTAAALSLIHI